MTDWTTVFTVAFFAIAEPFLVLWAAPRFTSRRVRADAVAIIDAEMVPRMKALVEDALGLADKKETDERFQTLSMAGVDARREFAQLEEAAHMAVAERAGPAAVIALQQAKALAPVMYKAAIKAGPDAVAALAEKLKGGLQPQGPARNVL